jgi:hypothetical protein
MKTDKGKTIVTLTRENYKQKVNNFMKENQFTVLNNNPMQNYQKTKRNTSKM